MLLRILSTNPDWIQTTSRIAEAGIVLTTLFAILMVHGRHGLFLNWFGDRRGHGYEYHLLAIALAIAIVVRGSGAFSIGPPFIPPMSNKMRFLAYIQFTKET